MDLLKFGMENRKHPSAVRRRLAEAALYIAKKEADVMEWRIQRKRIELPEAGDEDELLMKIREEIGKKASEDHK